MKLTATLCTLLVFAQTPQPRPGARNAPRPPASSSGVPEQGQRSVAPQRVEPPVVLAAETAWAGAEVLIPLASSNDAAVRKFAIRAIGRLENPSHVPQLMALSAAASTRDVASAIAQSLKGFDPRTNPELLSTVLSWMRRTGLNERADVAADVSTAIGRIAYATPEQVHGAEEVLVHIMDLTANDTSRAAIYADALRSVESLARLNARTTSLEPETVTMLVNSVNGSSANDFNPSIRADAVAAVVSAGALDADTAKRALKEPDDEARRLAMTVLTGAGAGLDEGTRIALITEGLRDKSGKVRYEALRAYVRHGAPANGCQPILDLLNDRDTHVVLAALDALGGLCNGNEDVTARVLAEVRTPAVVGSWHRETHAFVALARRSPDAAAIAMQAFVTHPVWWVRMYSVRAAAAMEDVARLDTLAYDTNDNVREAAIAALRRLKRPEADRAILAALDRPDYQLLRTAAMLLKESPRDERFFRPLAAALARVTREGKETSRDARIALLEAIAVHATADNATGLLPLLKDVDPVVAGKSAEIISDLTGKSVKADAVRGTRASPTPPDGLSQCVAVNLKSGRSFRLVMLPESAPVTVGWFLKLAIGDHYYDGLALHRVVPNFVVQGGGPGANEYAGYKEYMRDEIAETNRRGTVGLSTRGRNTADAQFFVNLVNNARLDYDYTIFARVFDGMDVVDAIEEGEEIRTINPTPCGRS